MLTNKLDAKEGLLSNGQILLLLLQLRFRYLPGSTPNSARSHDLDGGGYIENIHHSVKQTISSDSNVQLHVLLADDDQDDRFFFNKALQALPIRSQLITVKDGEQLMIYLVENSERLPDVLFLDLNMPRKNGIECLSEIKHNQKLKDLPVIIYSTAQHAYVSDDLYGIGAHYYFYKTDLNETKVILHYILNLLLERSLPKPGREEFVLTSGKHHVQTIVNK